MTSLEVFFSPQTTSVCRDQNAKPRFDAFYFLLLRRVSLCKKGQYGLDYWLFKVGSIATDVG